jgi:hypothetical protein
MDIRGGEGREIGIISSGKECLRIIVLFHKIYLWATRRKMVY